MKHPATARALVRLALVAIAGVAAATVWACNPAGQRLLPDAQAQAAPTLPSAEPSVHGDC